MFSWLVIRRLKRGEDLFGQISGPRKLLVSTKYHHWPVNFASSHPTLSSFEITFLFWSILPMFWCCTNTDDADDTTMPQLHASEQVLPFSKELTKELKTLERSQTAAKLAKKPSPHFFTIRLDRAPGTSFGLDVSAVGRVCMVNDVHPDSLVGEWNQQCFEAGDLDQAVQQWLRCSDDTVCFQELVKVLWTFYLPRRSVHIVFNLLYQIRKMSQEWKSW